MTLCMWFDCMSYRLCTACHTVSVLHVVPSLYCRGYRLCTACHTVSVLHVVPSLYCMSYRLRTASPTVSVLHVVPSLYCRGYRTHMTCVPVLPASMPPSPVTTTADQVGYHAADSYMHVSWCLCVCVKKIWRKCGIFRLVSSSPSCKWIPRGDKTTVCAIVPQWSRWDFVCPHHSWLVRYSAPSSTWLPSGVCNSTGLDFPELCTGTPVLTGGVWPLAAAPYICHLSFVCVCVCVCVCTTNLL